MQKTLIYVDTLTARQVLPSGVFVTKTQDMPTFERGTWQVLCINFVERTVDAYGTITLSPSSAMSGATYVLTADNDFIDDNSLMMKSYMNAEPFDSTVQTSNRFNIEGDWIDGGTADITQGQMSIRLNTDTVKFKEALGSKKSTNLNYINIKKHIDGLANPSTVAWIQFVALNTVKDWGESDPEEIDPNGGALVAIVNAFLNQPVVHEFSADGVSGWHSVQADTDRYYRYKFSGVGSEWSSTIKLADGGKGDKGDKGDPGAILEGNFIDVSGVTDGFIVLDSQTIPVSIEAPSGNIYGIEKRTMQSIDGTFRIDIAAYLAYENMAEFSGTWRVWRAGSAVYGGTGGDGAITNIGQIIAFAGNNIPAGFLPCNGALVSRTTYAELFAVIGTLYGEGDGTDTFALPDLRNRFMQGAGDDSAGTVKVPGLPDINGSFHGIYGLAPSGGESFYSGAFNSADSGNIYWNGGGSALLDCKVEFKASKADNIYGGSTTVQPPAVVINYAIKY